MCIGKMQYAKTIVKVSHNFELACLNDEEGKEEEKEERRKKTFWPSGIFVPYFCNGFSHHWVCYSS